jgi:hypothetical protein
MQLLCTSGLHTVVLPDWCPLGGLHCGQEGAGVTLWGARGQLPSRPVGLSSPQGQGGGQEGIDVTSWGGGKGAVTWQLHSKFFVVSEIIHLVIA